MPSGSKKRKAKKKKQAGVASELNQQHGIKEDSGNEQEVENEHDNDREQEQDLGHEEDPITPKTPVQSNEGEEKDKGKVEGRSSDAEEVGFLDSGFTQNNTRTSFQEVESTDSNLVIPENGGDGVGLLQNEDDVLSGGALEDKDGPTGNLSPLIGTDEAHPKATPARTLSSSSSLSSLSDRVRDDGDEVHNEADETRTDVGLIAVDLHEVDKNEVSSSKLVGSKDNETDQSLGPSTNVYETLPSPKDNDDTHVEMEAVSEELESSDGDESKLDVVSTMATLDANESIQSVGSVDSPSSVYSQQYMDHISNERAESASQDQDRRSEGFSETPYQELGSKVDFFNSESGDKDVYKEQIEGIEFPEEEDCHDNSLSEESSKFLRNEENIQLPAEIVNDSSLSEESLKGLSNEENIQLPTEIVNDSSLSEESLKGLRNGENIQVPTEVVSDNYATVMEELTQVAADLEKPQVTSSVSLAAAIEESEAILKGDENDAKESVMPLSKSESVNMRHMSAVSTSAEADEKVVSTSAAADEKVVSTIGDSISTTEQTNEDVVSVGGAGKDDMGLLQVQGTSADPAEVTDKEIASDPRNGTNEKKINLTQGESRTSWLNCCGIIDLITARRS